MRHLVDRRYLAEAERFSLRYTCSDCVHFDPVVRACAEGFPNHEHLQAAVAEGEMVCFCKSFELA